MNLSDEDVEQLRWKNAVAALQFRAQRAEEEVGKLTELNRKLIEEIKRLKNETSA